MDKIDNPGGEQAFSVKFPKCCCCWVLASMADLTHLETLLNETQRALPELRKQLEHGGKK
jgi:hypothetical protein